MDLQSSNIFTKGFNWLSGKVTSFQEKRHEARALLDEIDRIISDTKTKIPRISGYRKRLEEPVRLAREKIDAMTEQIPGPVFLDPKSWAKSPEINAIFLNRDEFVSWLHTCPTLSDGFRKYLSSDLYGLLVAEYHEKTSLGVGLVGEIIQKDVLQKSVYFENPRVVVAHSDIESARRELRHRILVMLFTHGLEKIADLQALTEELEKQQDILELKLRSAKRPGASNKMDHETEKEARRIIDDIDREINEIGRHPDSPEGHLKHVIDVLTHIDRHLSMRPLEMRLNRLGIRVNAASSEPHDEVSFAECTYTGGHQRSVIWIKVSRSALK